MESVSKSSKSHSTSSNRKHSSSSRKDDASRHASPKSRDRDGKSKHASSTAVADAAKVTHGVVVSKEPVVSKSKLKLKSRLIEAHNLDSSVDTDDPPSYGVMSPDVSPDKLCPHVPLPQPTECHNCAKSENSSGTETPPDDPAPSSTGGLSVGPPPFLVNNGSLVSPVASITKCGTPMTTNLDHTKQPPLPATSSELEDWETSELNSEEATEADSTVLIDPNQIDSDVDDDVVDDVIDGFAFTAFKTLEVLQTFVEKETDLRRSSELERSNSNSNKRRSSRKHKRSRGEHQRRNIGDENAMKIKHRTDTGDQIERRPSSANSALKSGPNSTVATEGTFVNRLPPPPLPPVNNCSCPRFKIDTFSRNKLSDKTIVPQPCRCAELKALELEKEAAAEEAEVNLNGVMAVKTDQDSPIGGQAAQGTPNSGSVSASGHTGNARARSLSPSSTTSHLSHVARVPELSLMMSPPSKIPRFEPIAHPDTMPAAMISPRGLTMNGAATMSTPVTSSTVAIPGDLKPPSLSDPTPGGQSSFSSTSVVRKFDTANLLDMSKLPSSTQSVERSIPPHSLQVPFANVPKLEPGLDRKRPADLMSGTGSGTMSTTAASNSQPHHMNGHMANAFLSQGMMPPAAAKSLLDMPPGFLSSLPAGAFAQNSIPSNLLSMYPGLLQSFAPLLGPGMAAGMTPSTSATGSTSSTTARQQQPPPPPQPTSISLAVPAPSLTLPTVNSNAQKQAVGPRPDSRPNAPLSSRKPTEKWCSMHVTLAHKTLRLQQRERQGGAMGGGQPAASAKPEAPSCLPSTSRAAAAMLQTPGRSNAPPVLNSTIPVNSTKSVDRIAHPPNVMTTSAGGRNSSMSSSGKLSVDSHRHKTNVTPQHQYHPQQQQHGRSSTSANSQASSQSFQNGLLMTKLAAASGSGTPSTTSAGFGNSNLDALAAAARFHSSADANMQMLGPNPLTAMMNGAGVNNSRQNEGLLLRQQEINAERIKSEEQQHKMMQQQQMMRSAMSAMPSYPFTSNASSNPLLAGLSSNPLLDQSFLRSISAATGLPDFTNPFLPPSNPAADIERLMAGLIQQQQQQQVASRNVPMSTPSSVASSAMLDSFAMNRVLEQQQQRLLAAAASSNPMAGLDPYRNLAAGLPAAAAAGGNPFLGAGLGGYGNLLNSHPQLMNAAAAAAAAASQQKFNEPSYAATLEHLARQKTGPQPHLPAQYPR